MKHPTSASCARSREILCYAMSSPPGERTAMLEVSTAIDDIGVCTTCGSFAVADRYLRLEGLSVHVFCSPDCFDAGLRAARANRRAAWLRGLRRLVLVAIVLGAWLAPREGLWRRRTPPVAADAPAATDDRPSPPPLPPGWFGPEWPPTEASVLAVLGRDAWVHPLAGPRRRMPRVDSRVFGAPRPGQRPAECRNGHCGVDLGGEIWGEHVRAVHDGVVDYVQRGANPDRGGRFVRISHYDGTVFTQYFHLAAIPREIERGVNVRSGQVIGLLGDSGVKESAPHLHFAVSVRPWPGGPERYVDPEPLVTLWPLHIPIKGSEIGLVTTKAEVGFPLGSALRRHARKGAPKKDAAGRAPDDAEDVAAPAPAAPDDGESAGETEPESGEPSGGGE
jgi:murein DD-endopeptidase MepM/ murein hydrolase activator NlpD